MFPAANSAHLTGRLELTGRHREQQVTRLYLGWQHVLGLVGCWVQKTVKKWTVPQGVTRQVLEMMWRGDFAVAGPMSLNLKAMAATAWSLHLLHATPADPIQVKLKRRAGLLLVLQEVAGIAHGTRLLLATQVVLPRIHACRKGVAGLRMTSCHRQPNSVSRRAAEGRRPKLPRPEQMAAWIAVNDEEASTENTETTTST